MFDIDVGYSCDHLVRYFCTLTPTGSPDEYSIALKFPLPPQSMGNDQFQLFRNEVLEAQAVFLRQGLPKLVKVEQVSVPPAYPADDFEVSHTVDPNLCPKCKSQTQFG